jgi:hypothetical protein
MYGTTRRRCLGLRASSVSSPVSRRSTSASPETPLGHPPEKLFQGPIADALTHTGQIGMMRRMAGHPVRGENYFKAEITAGRVGPEQSSPVREFD